MINKISLGTVQFGLDYGINNKNGIIQKNEVFRILDYCNLIGINTLDTAHSYGISEEIIGQYIKNTNNSFNIISKFPNQDNIEDILDNTLKNLNINNLYAYLSHDFNFIKDNTKNWNKIIDLKNKGKISKIGFSLYYTEELDFLLDKNIDFNILQIPFNVFDRRFENYFKLLKEKNIEIHIRSVFLQGLFFKENIDNYFLSVKNKLDEINKISIELNIELSKLLLIFCLYYNEIDKIVIGVDSLKHLQSNLIENNIVNDLKDIIHLKLKGFMENNLDILIPSRWKTK